ncbi:hypothetical protein LTR93_011793 [Exophiala xenobiotica]|nr:hypothetical protein LTR93_011793 [Exophiala xenobiotica]
MSQIPLQHTEEPSRDASTRLDHVEGQIQAIAEALGQNLNLREQLPEQVVTIPEIHPSSDPMFISPRTGVTDSPPDLAEPYERRRTPSGCRFNLNLRRPPNFPPNVHISNMPDITGTTGKIERIPDYKGDRKNDAAAIWLMRADNSIAEQEQLSQKRYTDRQKIAFASHAL